jgi:hypothetical protein
MKSKNHMIIAINADKALNLIPLHDKKTDEISCKRNA